MIAFLRIALIFLFFGVLACQSNDKKISDDSYSNEINSQRALKNSEFSDSLTSPLNPSDLDEFKGLQYFEPNAEYRIAAIFTIDTSMPVFSMATTTDRLPNYRVYGSADFTLKDTLCRLVVYQNADYMDDPVFGNTLFIPFRDATNGIQTYEAGRYFDIPIPNDNDSIFLDFNTAYNPYCAYDKRWSCPLVPSENWLKLAILAGEKKFK